MYREKSKYSKLEAPLSNANLNLSSATNGFLFNLVGKPRLDGLYGEKDGPLNNPQLEKLMVRDVDIGPFKVKGLRPAVESLTMVMADICKQYKEIYDRLGHDGMLVVRYQRPTAKKPIGCPNRPISNHSWGTAIDIKIDGLLDDRGDKKSQNALNVITPTFNKHKWYWGGTFPTEDAMHFEVSKEKLLEWHNAGLFGPVSNRRREAKIPETAKPANTSSSSHHRSMFDWLQRGDRGPKVVQLQEALKSRGYNLTSDGKFGRITEAALMDFQRKQGLPANGMVGPKTAAYLIFF